MDSKHFEVSGSATYIQGSRPAPEREQGWSSVRPDNTRENRLPRDVSQGDSTYSNPVRKLDRESPVTALRMELGIDLGTCAVK